MFRPAPTFFLQLAVVAATFVPLRSEAADRFGVVGVDNSTRVTIRLQHRWGDGQWASETLPPGTHKWYWWEYTTANEDKSPPFHVRFDSDLSPGRFVEKYDLKKNRAPAHEWHFAHKYTFKYDGNEKFVELFEDR